MKTYLSTFVSGLQEPVQELLKENIKDVKIDLALDGLIVYQTDVEIEKIKKIRFFNNSFLVLRSFKESIESMLQTVASTNFNTKEFVDRGKTFRLMISDENNLVTGDRALTKKIEDNIAKRNRLRVSSHKPDVEFWFLSRREGVGFFMLRLTKNVTNKKLHPGELRPELAHVMCYLSDPSKDDIFLDPFAGYGAIPLERAKSFSVNLIFANEKNAEQKKYIKNKLDSKKLKKQVILKADDALDMKSFEDGFITKIVTDPPWGEFENIDINRFYPSMIKEFVRVLKKNGIIVILTAKKKELEEIVAGQSLEIKEKYDILVSGKKAAIYKLVKT